MRLTASERRQRILQISKSDPDGSKLWAEYENANRRFSAIADRLPAKLREFLWLLPGAGYFLHHRILTLVCENMRFPEETDEE